jgi:hypothetical protein
MSSHPHSVSNKISYLDFACLLTSDALDGWLIKLEAILLHTSFAFVPFLVQGSSLSTLPQSHEKHLNNAVVQKWGFGTYW